MSNLLSILNNLYKSYDLEEQAFWENPENLCYEVIKFKKQLLLWCINILKDSDIDTLQVKFCIKMQNFVDSAVITEENRKNIYKKLDIYKHIYIFVFNKPLELLHQDITGLNDFGNKVQVSLFPKWLRNLFLFD